MRDLITNFFKKSKNQKGYIYICKYEAYEIEQNVRTKEYTKYGWVTKWKYGKTKNIEQRMEYYGKNYTLIESWKVSHLTMREENIRSHPRIDEDRHYAFKDGRDEHVDFDCYNIVKEEATSKIELKKSNTLGRGLEIITSYSCGYESISDGSCIFEYLKVK